ncbi:hypothetical protein [Corynebacterium casei]|uniref:hypothetical protein n=1 Tax=Corynebacterium casei TaxID=160386 RepID=UPI001866165D|nr:hypothetical protein [Corynebacterium casei]
MSPPSAFSQTDMGNWSQAEIYETKVARGLGTGGVEWGTGRYIHSTDGSEYVDYVSIISLEIPYPGIEFRRNERWGDPSPDSFQFRLTGGAIYPASIDLQATIRVVYADGSYEDAAGSTSITPIASLVAGSPASPTTTLLAPPIPTTTETVTVTPEPSEPVTETVTVTPEPSEPVTETVTVTPEPSEPVTETVTVTPEPSEPVTETVTVTPEPSEPVTETVTVTPEPGGSSSENNGAGGLIAAVLAIIAAVGGVGFWFLNQL